MKKRTKLLIALAIILCIGNIGRNIIEFGAISAYLLNNSSLDAKNLTGIDFSKGEKIVEVYDMGGFPLDGMKFEAWRFDREYIVSLREGFFEENGWKRCPVSDAMRETLYGCETEGDIYCTSEFTYPYDKERLLFPEVKGYYFFYNLEENIIDPMNEVYLNNRNCDTYIVALYDPVNYVVYYGYSDL